MRLLNILWSSLISMKLMLFLTLSFAVASAVATFIENDHGVNTSWALVYGTWWFELIQILLGVSIVGNIIRYAMYKKKKWPVFIFHVAFLIILLGSGITRYFGYEGVMHIREGQTEYRMLSADAFLQIRAQKDEKSFYKEDIVYVSALGGERFKKSMDIEDKELTIDYKGFIEKAVKTAVADPNGQPLAVFVIPTPQGPEKYFVKSGDSLDLGIFNVYFDTSLDPTHPYLHLFTTPKGIEFKSNVTIPWLKMIDQTKGIYLPNTVYAFDERRMYTIQGVQLVTKAVLLKGVETVVDEDEYKKSMRMPMKMDALSALIVDVTYDGIHKEVALLGKGKRFKGYTQTFTIANTHFSLEWGSKLITLPFSLSLRDFSLVKYPGSMSPSSYESHITLIDTNNSVKEEHTIYMNHTLDYGGFLFFQSSYDKDEQGTILSVNHDPGKWPTYLGYFLLSVGLLLNLFNPHSRFGRLARMRYEYKAPVSMIAFMLVFFVSYQPLQASVTTIDLEHANHYATLLVQGHDGRIKPLDTLAIDLLNKISGKKEMLGLNHDQILLGMAIDPNSWKQQKMIKVTHPKLKKVLGLSEKERYFTYAQAFDASGNYKLQTLADDAIRKRPAIRDTYDKDLIKVDERVNIAYMIYSGHFMKVFPLENDPNHTWYYPDHVMKEFPLKQKNEIASLLYANRLGLEKGFNQNSWEDANKAIDAMIAYQKQYAQEIVPSDFIIKAELLYNDLNAFERLFPLYLLAGMVLLILIFIRLFRPEIGLSIIIKSVLILLAFAFLLHTLSLGLRWYVSGHAPWSNGYEAMLYISWTIVLAGISFARSSELALATTSIFAGIALFVAHLSWLDPQIGSMVPVLKSYWLTIHVSIITASYGFLGLSALLGSLSLIFYVMLYKTDQRVRISATILESTRISEMSMIVGLSLLTVGNFLGGVWANESWGRYWGWDPKETWALVTILVYAFVMHLRFVPLLRSVLLFNALSVIAYSSVIMTYFGVNYYLSGLHSYASGDPVPVPEWIYYIISIVMILIIIAWFNRKKLYNITATKKGTE